MPTNFFFVRHGETDRNANGTLPDGSDELLNMTGRLQAAETARNIVEKKIDVVVYSPLQRAQITGEIIHTFLGDRVLVEQYDTRLTEVNFGGLKGKTWDDASILYGTDQKSVYDKQEYDFLSHGGDSFETVKKRVYEFIEEMKDKHAGKNILVVTHAGVIRCIYKVEKDEVFMGKAPGNATIHQFVF